MIELLYLDKTVRQMLLYKENMNLLSSNLTSKSNIQI